MVELSLHLSCKVTPSQTTDYAKAVGVHSWWCRECASFPFQPLPLSSREQPSAMASDQPQTPHESLRLGYA
jgi:hypothetical protein